MAAGFLVPNSPSTAYGGPPPLTQGRQTRSEHALSTSFWTEFYQNPISVVILLPSPRAFTLRYFSMFRLQSSYLQRADTCSGITIKIA